MAANRASTDHPKAEPKQEMDAIREDLAALKSDVGDLIHALAGRGSDKANYYAHAASDKAHEIGAAAQHQAEEAHDRLAIEVAQRPLLWLAGAAVVGALVARGVNR